uniref:Uncharacterized protein n=1 Tax=Trichobilharzia regenti TaxID=157069 RepID=A0AA85K3S7_TRIRE|nr:unnamed protein product [Trichobilharzia regenti]
MGILILSALVILQCVIISTEADKTLLLHVRWLPTHCYHQECQVEDGQKWDISKLRSLPQLEWLSDSCPNSPFGFWNYDFDTITELSKYWSNPLDEFMHHDHLYREYATCTVVDSDGPSPNLYFNRGIDLFKLASPRTISIREGETYSTRDFEHSLKNKYHAQPKLICAENDYNKTFLHEIVFCFNEHSTLVDCPAEYANDLQEYVQSIFDHSESEYSEQIHQQKLCGDSFIVPEYKMAETPIEEPEVDYSEDTSSSSSSSSNIFSGFWNWFWGV